MGYFTTFPALITAIMCRDGRSSTRMATLCRDGSTGGIIHSRREHTPGEGPGCRGGEVMKGPRNHPSGGNAGPDSPGATSWTLLDGAGRGDPASRERLVHLYGPLVLRRYLARIHPQDAEDLFQE